jgi:hypothetical protein
VTSCHRVSPSRARMTRFAPMCTGVEFVAHYAEIGSGHGGYNQDHEFFGYRQSI